jgi:hypothetical protein
MADNNLAGLGDETLANAQGISRAMNDIAGSSRNLNRELGETLTTYSNYFTTVKNSANKVAEIQNNALKTQKAANQALGEQSKQLNTVRALNIQINSLMTEAAKASASSISGEKERGALLKIQAELLGEARDNAKELASVYGGILRDATKLDNSVKFCNTLSNVSKNIPGLGKLAAPFEKAAVAARKVAVEQANYNKVEKVGLMYRDAATKRYVTQQYGKAAMEAQSKSKAGAGMSAMGGEMMSMAGGPVGIAAMIGKFILDIFLSVNRQVVEISKNLNVSTDVADKMRLHFNDIAMKSGSIVMTTQTLIDAQTQLTNSLGAYANLQDSTLRNQVFFTKNLGMSEDAAADLNLMFEAQGQNAESVAYSMNESNNAASKATGRIVPFNKLMSSVAKTSKEIAGYFGFNAKSMAEGVRQVSKFGLELKDAASVSKTLLDFESSIGNELTLELLTGKEFNLEKARSKALTGDIAGATADVMSQMQNLTEEQRKNPLIMEQMAAMSGLTADQINNAYIVNKKLTKENRDYVKSLQDQGRTEEANKIISAASAGQNIDAIKATITAQDAFAATLEKLKDKLSGLVNNNILDKFTQILVAFVNTVAKKGFSGLLFGDTFKEEYNKAKTADIVSAATSGRKGLDVSTLTEAQQAKLTNTPQMTATVTRLQKEQEDGKMGWFSSLVNAIQPGSRPNSLLSGNEEDVAKAKIATAELEGMKSGKLSILPTGQVVSAATYEKLMQKQIELMTQANEIARNKSTVVKVGTQTIAEDMGVNAHKQ